MISNTVVAGAAPQVIRPLTWADIDKCMDLIERSVRNLDFDIVIGISRAGLIPAVILAHRLNIRAMAVIEIRRTISDDAHAFKSVPVVTAAMNEAMLDGKRAILVDDIVGAGLTMDHAREWAAPRCQSLRTATVVVNEANLGERSLTEVVDHFGCTVRGWVRFPWETAL